MPKRRTKKQKQQARHQYVLPKMMEMEEKVVGKVKKAGGNDDGIMMYDVALLRQDLVKTLMVSGTIIGVLLLVYYNY